MRRTAVLIVVLLVGVPLVLADAPQTGVVTGTVVDPDGAPMPGVTVQLQSERGAMTKISDQDGRYMFVFLVPGSYTVRADMPGFQPAVGEITVSAGGRSDVQLQLAETMGEEIVITGESPLVNRFDMTSGGTLETKELEKITGQGQQYRSRLLFLPDVINESGVYKDQGLHPAVAGLAGSRQMFFIDGVDTSFARWGGGSQVNLPATAIGEMKLESTGADAQFSRSIGSYVRTIVRSGTNDFHGSAYYQMQNLAWDAENEHVPVARPDEVKDGIDVSLGGPILRDKLFFYVGYREMKNPGLEVMANGIDVVESGGELGSRLAKLDWRPSANHSLSSMYVLTPSDTPWWARKAFGDLPTVAVFEYPGDVTTLRWNWAVTDSLLLTAHAARATAEQNRSPYAESTIDPACDGVTPCGNNWVYRPLGPTPRYPNALYPGLLLNGIALPMGFGDTAFPRDQINATLEIFTGVHDIKAGVDYQELEWTADGLTPPLCMGRDFGYDVLGGFRSNSDPVLTQRGFCNFYPTKETWMDGWGPVTSGSENIGVFVRDRLTLNRWTLNLGLRADRQKHENDVGETVLDSTDIAPRLAASYDVFGDSTLLLMATAGRYYAQMEMAWAASFNQMPQARDQYEAYFWNPETSDYDIFWRAVTPSTTQFSEVDPYYKDQVSLGLEWQFHPNWAFKVRGSAWRVEDYPQIYDQINDSGGLYQAVENTPGIKAERQALELVVQRRFANNWTMSASYVYSETEGNCEYGDNGGCANNYGELLAFTTSDGAPYSHYNRYGSLYHDRPHVFKMRGAYDWQLGKGHSINIGGLAYYVDGPAWTPTRSVTDPDTGATVTLFHEPRGSRRIGGRTQLDLNLQWSFPISGRFNGWIRTDILNVTDDQVQIDVAGMSESCFWVDGACTGEPQPRATSDSYQFPRHIRVQIGFNF